MTILPTAATNVGTTSGGGLLDSFKNAMAGASGGAGGAPAQAPKQSDGSVGLFDGVGKKALFGGIAGMGLGFLPFLPGGPILGGIVGAIAGAGWGMFKNYKEMKAIREENAAVLAAVGVQPQTQEQANALLSGNLAPLMPNQGPGGAMMQVGPGQAAQAAPPPPVAASAQAEAAEQQALIQQQAMLQQQAAQQQALTQKSPVPVQGRPAQAVLPGQATAMAGGSQQPTVAPVDAGTQDAVAAARADQLRIEQRIAVLKQGWAQLTPQQREQELQAVRAELLKLYERLARLQAEAIFGEQRRELETSVTAGGGGVAAAAGGSGSDKTSGGCGSARAA